MINCRDAQDAECQIRTQLVKQYAEAIKMGVTSGSVYPVEGLAKTVDFAYWLFEYDYSNMAWSLTNIINGFDPNKGSVWYQAWCLSQGSCKLDNQYFIGENWLPYKNNPEYNDPNWGGAKRQWIHSQIGDWREAYWDKTANQAYHFWFYVAVSFFDGKLYSSVGNIVHEGIGPYESYDYIHSPQDEAPPVSQESQPDYDLATVGSELGTAMFMEKINYYRLYGGCPQWRIPHLPPLSFNPGLWIRSHLK
jgi:hypothetical protein